MTDEMKKRVDAAAKEFAKKFTIHIPMDDYERTVNEETIEGISGHFKAGATQFYAEGYRAGLEAAAMLAKGCIYFDALEMTAWMGLSDAKRIRYAKLLGENAAQAISALIQAEEK